VKIPVKAVYFATVFFCLLVVKPQSAMAEDSPIDKAIAWFRSLSTSIDKNVDVLKRKKVVRLSGNFANSLARLEQDKRIIARQVTDNTFDETDIEASVALLVTNTRRARTDFEILKPKLVEVAVMTDVAQANINEYELEQQLKNDLDGKVADLETLKSDIHEGRPTTINRKNLAKRINRWADKVGKLHRAVEQFRARLRTTY